MGGKIGVLVDVETDVVNDAVKEMAKNVAMQVAALKPLYTSDSEVSAEYIEHEKEILLAQIQNDPKEASKPEKVIQGMIQGRINKEMKEICLLDQTYVKAEDGKVILRVKDTGIGIPKEHQERIFERFYRVDKSRSKSTGGTGLGLAIVKHIVARNNAQLDMDSEPGKGTDIKVTFDAYREDEQ